MYKNVTHKTNKRILHSLEHDFIYGIRNTIRVILNDFLNDFYPKHKEL